MNIAVFSRGDVTGGQVEDRLRRLAGAEELAISLAVRDDLDPLDIVLLLHGVRNAADLHPDATVEFLDDRHVFLFALVGRLGDQVLHGLSAADQTVLAGGQNLHDITAADAFVDLESLCHYSLPLSILNGILRMA